MYRKCIDLLYYDIWHNPFFTFSGSLQPNKTAQFSNDFGKESRLGSNTLSFRGNVNIREGQTVQEVFLDTGDGLLVQELPFSVTLKQFHVDYYENGMPKNFASDLIVTDRQSGQTYTPTVKVNHPFTLHGISLYQASFGDGGSSLTFRAWNLGTPSAASTELKAASLSAFPLHLGQNQTQQYTLEFTELRPLNVEDEEQTDNAASQPANLRHRLNEARSVQQSDALRNVGPTITFRLRDQAGQAREYVNYMLPLRRGGDFYFATGERVMQLMLEMNRELGTTLVLVTHDRALAALCERRLVVEAGRVSEGE